MATAPTYDDLAQENSHLRQGLDLIHRRCKVARPNGTTRVLDRIAVAALSGRNIEEASARQGTTQ